MATHPIFIAAIAPTLVVLGILAFILRRSTAQERPLIGLFILLELPMHFVSTHLVRQPFNRWFDTVVDPGSLLGLLLRSFQAPLVEESFKLWLIFIAYFMSRLTPQNAVRIGMAIGATFGLSEVWSLAYTISQVPGTGGHPWYHFVGFIQERILVAPVHGVFAAAAARQIAKGGRYIVIGVLTGLALHYGANFPIFLVKLFGKSANPTVIAVVMSLYVALYAVLMYGLLIYFVYGREVMRKLMSGYARCPECSAVYKRPKTRVNVGPFMSYEKCASCNKSHWVRLKDLEDQGPASP